MTSKSAPKDTSPPRTAAERRKQTMIKFVVGAMAFTLLATLAAPLAAGF